MLLKQHPYRMHTVNRLCVFQALSTRDVFDQVEVNESFDGIHRRNDDSDMSTRAQTSPRTTARPCVAAFLHYVLVIPQVVEVEQSIH